jgi:hypothetical protein
MRGISERDFLLKAVLRPARCQRDFLPDTAFKKQQLETARRPRKIHHAIPLSMAAVAIRERHRNSGLAVPLSLNGLAINFPGRNSVSQSMSGMEPALNRGCRAARAAVNAHPISKAITILFQLARGFTPASCACGSTVENSGYFVDEISP